MTEMNPEYRGVYLEIFRLHTMLEEAGIQHDFMEHVPDISGVPDRERGFYQICYPSRVDWHKSINDPKMRSVMCSVTEGYGTSGCGEDRLEMMGFGAGDNYDILVGYLTAENIFSEINRAEEVRRESFRHIIPSDEKEE